MMELKQRKVKGKREGREKGRKGRERKQGGRKEGRKKGRSTGEQINDAHRRNSHSFCNLIS
jgi:hypothetical protein